jgi:hypothetical protein
MSMLGAYWAHGYFEERPNFGKKDLILEKNNWQEKQHMRGKATCKRSNMQSMQVGKPNNVRVRVFYKECNIYKPGK